MGGNSIINGDAGVAKGTHSNLLKGDDRKKTVAEQDDLLQLWGTKEIHGGKNGSTVGRIGSSTTDR